MRQISESTDKVHLTLMSRAQGETLHEVGFRPSEEQRLSLKNQLFGAMKQWSNFTAPVAKKVDGRLLYDCLISYCFRRTSPRCKKIGRTTEEWFGNISKIHKTKDPSIIEEKFQELKRNFPKPEPYVLTHGDLNFTNIIVNDDK